VPEPRTPNLKFICRGLKADASLCTIPDAIAAALDNRPLCLVVVAVAAVAVAPFDEAAAEKVWAARPVGVGWPSYSKSTRQQSNPTAAEK
jgi:hypothetical protein